MKNFKPLSKYRMRELGLPHNSLNMVDKIEDLRENPPNIVIGKCKQSTKFVQNRFKEQEIIKKGKKMKYLIIILLCFIFKDI